MLKQILSKIPRKSSKSDSIGSPRRDSSARGSQVSSNLQRTTSGTVFSSRTANVVKRIANGTVFPAAGVGVVEPPPPLLLLSFKDVPSSERINLFISKLNHCSVVFDFNDPSKCIQEKEHKRVILIDLVDFVASNPPKFTEQAIISMCKMTANNLFRSFPHNNIRSATTIIELEDDEPKFDPAWSHLQLTYELLLKFITSPSLEAKVAKRYINHSFISKLLDLFDSEDPRERECLKTILHRIYGKFMIHRPFLRKSMSNVFYRFVFETGSRHYGIAELLEILGSVISGFALPLKEEHKIFFTRALIPLHKPKCLGVYFQQLSYCITQFIEKEPKMASIVIRGLLKHWPITSTQKEVLLLGEIEEILEVISMAEFEKVMAPLFWRIGCCINSCHFQVAERALFFWNNDQIVNLIAHNRHVILPIIFPALERNAKNHWNESVLNLSMSLRKMFIDMDDSLFMDCETYFKDEREKISVEENKRKEKWERVEKMAKMQPVTGKTAVMVTPFANSITC
ncbi:serine/threonine protein phosphatase 2A 57 kDa regulatory subunit B' kappa isoform-like [Impatiens glandulifera]|uniref:serine/threonine protein phosphatase 2A 57 kDa regulatory subunit B' kappa isoform-like n=1 Tax=Impatiens glandulifera TaxID=253017 RepID=UPI001FB18D69|nr:serine/threonine protein phosphatase 2A 57 kDa regulatory subunit B' kappa isoform-like [Impatiens glandulifera]